MSEILTMVRESFRAVDIDALWRRKEEVTEAHIASVSPLERDADTLKKRGDGIAQKYKELIRDALPIEVAALDAKLEESRLLLDTARLRQRGIQGHVAKQEATVKMIEARAKFGTKYPEINIRDVPFVRKAGLELVLVPIPLWALHINPKFLLSSYHKTEDCYGKNGNEQWFKLIRTECMRQCGEGDVRHCWIGSKQVTDKSRFIFPGLIPPDIKKKIKVSEPDFEVIFLLVDAATLVEVNPDPDPLVVGWHPDDPDRFWLIAEFDLTPTERMFHDDVLAAHEKMLVEVSE